MITVSDALTTHLHTCKTGETLDRAAKIMWEHDCSEVPVVDDGGFLIAMVSDRSVGICAYTQGKPLTQIPVTCGAPERVEVVRTDDSLDFAHKLMRKHHLRCLPVVERTGRLIGLLSITDIIRCTSPQGEPRLSANSRRGEPPSRGLEEPPILATRTGLPQYAPRARLRSACVPHVDRPGFPHGRSAGRAGQRIAPSGRWLVQADRCLSPMGQWPARAEPCISPSGRWSALKTDSPIDAVRFLAA